MKRKAILFILMSICLTCFTYFFHTIDGDELWGYGFSYNIAKGAIPYRDFNMVLLPFYSLLMAIPLKLVANNLFVFHLFNAIFVSIILVIIDNKKNFNSLCICIFVMILPTVYSYNCFIMMLLLLLIYVESKEDSKYKNELIGLILGIILTTKQNIGIVLFIPYILNSKTKLKSLVYYLIPVIFVFIYLILNNTLLECIDYCFLGLGNFKDNFIIKSPAFLIVIIVVIIYLINQYIKTKDLNYIYLLLFQFINFPLIDFYHLTMGVIPVVWYLLSQTDNKYVYIILYILPIIVAARYICYAVIDEGGYLSSSSVYKYRHMTSDLEMYGRQHVELIKSNPDKRFFNFSNESYYVKILLNEKIDKFDLINKGNMGSVEDKYIDEIDEICKREECQIILNYNEFDKEGAQLNYIIRDYVVKNYEVCKKLNSAESIYCKNESK